MEFCLLFYLCICVYVCGRVHVPVYLCTCAKTRRGLLDVFCYRLSLPKLKACPFSARLEGPKACRSSHFSLTGSWVTGTCGVTCGEGSLSLWCWHLNSRPHNFREVLTDELSSLQLLSVRFHLWIANCQDVGRQPMCTLKWCPSASLLWICHSVGFLRPSSVQGYVICK